MNQDFKLKIFEKQFRKKGLVAIGHSSIKKLMKENDTKALDYLLRYHKQESINTDYEVKFRKNIDELLDYYSLFFIAIIAGYFSAELPEKNIKEIKEILDNHAVKTFYTEYYKLNLPNALLKFITKPKDLIRGQIFTSNKEKDYLFEKLLLLHIGIKRNKEIDNFLFLLDEGNVNDINIFDLLNSLDIKNEKRLQFDTVRRNTLNHLLKGFVQYLDFLNEYVELMKETENKYPYLWTTMFHLQGYWFFKLTKIMGTNILSGLKKLNQSLDEFNLEAYSKNMAKEAFVNIDERYNNWKEKSKAKIFHTERSLLYLKECQLKLTVLDSIYNDYKY